MSVSKTAHKGQAILNSECYYEEPYAGKPHVRILQRGKSCEVLVYSTTGSFWWNFSTIGACGSVLLAVVCVFYMIFALDDYDDVITLAITAVVLCAVALVIAISGLFTTAVGTAVLQNGTVIAVRITSFMFPTHIGVSIGNGPFMDCPISNGVPFGARVGNEVIRIHHGFNLFTVKNYILEEYDASDGGAGYGNGGGFPPFPTQPPYYTGVR